MIKMAYEFKFPDVGQGITEGEIVKWHVREGGDVIVVIGQKGEKYVPGKAVDVTAATAEKALKTAEKKDAGAVVGALPGSMADIEKGIFAMPAVRRLAAELKVDLSKVRGTCPGGRITENDVRKAAGIGAPAATEVAAAAKEDKVGEEPQMKVTKKYDMWGFVRREPFKGVRKATAEKMAFSASKTAAVTNFDEADITVLAELREKEKAAAGKKGIKLTFLSFVIKAVFEALKKPEHNIVNSSLDETAQEIVIKEYYNIGFAVATEAGLVVPVIKRVEQKAVLAIASEVGELAGKARSRKLDMADMMGGTFTISNIGSIGGTFFTPIINYPEAAILGIGKIVEKPVARDGKIVVRKIMPLSLTYDHRLIDGAKAAAFLNTVISYLENPKNILL